MSIILKELQKYANKNRAINSARYFKTGKGEYGYGDIFLGLKVPQSRKISKELSSKIDLDELQNSLSSRIHEERLVSLFILIEKYKRAKDKKEIFDFYLKNKSFINNWDLVDTSAPNIVGDYLVDRDKDILYKLAISKILWDKRIAIISTLAFIRNGIFDETFKISKILLKDNHDLIHKAIGWMLREAWKKNPKEVEEFIRQNYKDMPRTTLRYAIERMSDIRRKKWLLGHFD